MGVTKGNVITLVSLYKFLAMDFNQKGDLIQSNNNQFSTLVSDFKRRKSNTKAMTLFIIFAMLSSIVLIGCGGNDRPTIPTITTTPSSEDIIQAVRRSVEGRTNLVTENQQESTLHTCSQIDVDLDPYMPHNPKLANVLMSEQLTQPGKLLPSIKPETVSRCPIQSTVGTLKKLVKKR